MKKVIKTAKAFNLPKWKPEENTVPHGSDKPKIRPEKYMKLDKKSNQRNDQEVIYKNNSAAEFMAEMEAVETAQSSTFSTALHPFGLLWESDQTQATSEKDLLFTRIQLTEPQTFWSKNL